MNPLIKLLFQLLGICLLAVSLPVLFIVGITALILCAVPLALLCVAVVCFAASE